MNASDKEAGYAAAGPVARAREIIKHHLDSIAANPSDSSRIPPIMLWGPPGVGKSTVIRELADTMGIGFIDVRLAQREPVDIRGLPVPREDRTGVDWLVSSEWPREGAPDTPERGIILFDELTAADATLQVAAYEFILDRRLGELYEVPEGWYIVAAGNRSKDAAVARTMSSALANRFLHLEVESDPTAWLEWAFKNGIIPEVIAFIRFRPDMLLNMTGNLERGWPSPRSWERVSVEIQLAERSGLSSRALDFVIEGLIGPGAGIEFNGFRNWSSRLPDMERMLLGEIEPDFPTRSDLQYAAVSAMTFLYKSSEGGARDKMTEGMFTFLMHISADWCAMAWEDLRRLLDESDFENLLGHERYPDLGKKLVGI